MSRTTAPKTEPWLTHRVCELHARANLDRIEEDAIHLIGTLPEDVDWPAGTRLHGVTGGLDGGDGEITLCAGAPEPPPTIPEAKTEEGAKYPEARVPTEENVEPLATLQAKNEHGGWHLVGVTRARIRKPAGTKVIMMAIHGLAHLCTIKG